MNYLLDFRAAGTGGAVVPGRLVAAPGLGTAVDLRAERSIAFLVHGYNVNRASGAAVLSRFAGQLPPAGAAYVGVLWPGDHWTRAVSYPFEGNDADDTARELTKFINDNVAKGSALSFVSHSLGARVVMGTIKALRAADYALREVGLLAAAIDDFSLARPKDYLAAVAKVRRVAVLASHQDRVLKLAYPIGDFLQAFVFFRRDDAGLALGSHGPRPSGGNAVPAGVFHRQIPDGRGSDHGHYLPGDPAGQSAIMTANQASAVAFAAAVLEGTAQPAYS